MKRFVTILAAGLFALAPAVPVRAQTPAELAQTAAYLAAFQNPDGGFAGKVGGPSSLGATSSVVRTLKFVGGSIPDVLTCIKYVKSCYDPNTGGFTQTPGGKPDVGTTASGLMAIADLKTADKSMIDGALKFFSENAKSYEEVRIAIAGMEAVKTKSADFPKWEAQIKEGRNPDGTFGQGPALAFETGGKAAALLRMGVELDKKEAIAAAMKAAQLSDGGWSQKGDKTDFGATYRIMRAFFMMKERPDLERLRGFIAKRRSSDGGYASQPGGEASPGGTYFASICLYWARILDGEPALFETAGFRPLFNGKDLTGWEGDTSIWNARDGMLVGTSKGLNHNDFLATEATANSFALRLEIKLVADSGNSGIQFRSVRVPGHEMAGYQADVGPGWWGALYDESRRNKILVQPKPEALKALHKGDWNLYQITAKGPNINLSLNGTQTVSYKEPEAGIAGEGKFAVQIHAGGAMEVLFKNIYLQALPEPSSDSANSPGFHLRTLKQGSGDRKYTVYIPQGYDGTTPMPVVLFLHGAGERGEDGVSSAQVGLGPAILNNVEKFKAIAVIPQAKQTWAANSDDAKAALAALDEVLGSLECDRKKVMITGLSMGGRGTWEVAAANPDRFAAVVPICGMGRPESVKSLAALPVWAFVGDADRDATVLNSRAMVEGIAGAGAKPKYTEYRGVGHNSWDRAYNDPKLIDWMLSQTRN